MPNERTHQTRGRKANQLATLNDVAKAAGVSVSTVSKVLNDKSGVSADNRHRVMQFVNDLGYQKAESKTRAISDVKSVSIVTFDRYAANDLYYVDTMRGLTEEAHRMGWEVNLDLALIGDGYTNVDPKTLFRRGKPECAILLGLDQPDVVEAVAALDIPAVIVNGMDPLQRLSSVSPDHYFGSYIGTRYLVEKAHRRFHHVSHLYRDTIVQRIDGLRQALSSAGIAFDVDRDFLDTGSANFFSLDASQAIEKRLEQGDFDYTAIICASDMLAIGTSQALLSAGYRIPEDISIVGFDDLPISQHCEIPLTTIHIERGEMGRAAIQILEEEASGRAISKRRIGMSMRLVERMSVAPPPQ